jgi:hypothetical protein
MLLTKFPLIWPNGFRGEEFKKSAIQKQDSPVAAMFVNGSRQNEQSSQMTFHRCFLPSVSSFWPSGFRVEDLKKSANQTQELPVAAMFVNGSGRNRGPSIDASYQVSVHLAEGFQRRRLKCEKLTDDGQQTPSDGKSSPCLWQGELKKEPLILRYIS